MTAVNAIDVADVAGGYVRAGLSVLPIRADGSKAPALRDAWQPFMSRRANADELRAWFANKPIGVAIVGGAVSGGLEILDFDKPGLFDEWLATLDAFSPDAAALARRLPRIATPSGGMHLYYRCTAIGGSQKLAKALKPFTDTTGKTKDTLIETKGEAGYVLAPGSPPGCHKAGKSYAHVAGAPLTSIPAIGPAERDVLLRVARSFDERPQDGREQRRPVVDGAGDRPGDDFNVRATWSDILEPAGWVQVRSRGDKTAWRRPGKSDEGISATTGHCGDNLYVFSSNAAPFEADRAYSKFTAYGRLHHAGDFRAAASDLAMKGYGEQRERRLDDGKTASTPEPTAVSKPGSATPAATAASERLRPLSPRELVAVWRQTQAAAVVPTGIRSLDAAIGGGLAVEQVTTELGYTGVGKSELVRQVGSNAARAGHSVVHIDVELGVRRIAERNISQAADVPSSLLRRPGELTEAQIDNIESAVAKMSDLPILTICPGGAPALLDLEAAIVAALGRLPKDKPPLVILDSAQRLAAGAPGDTQRLQMQFFMVWMSALAQKTKAAFLVTSEQKRSQDGGRPTPEDALTSGAESRAIEFVSDCVIALVPAENAEDAVAEDAASTFERRVSVLVCKTREGRTGYLPEDLVFVGPCWGMRVDVREDELTEAIMSEMADDEVHTATDVAKAISKRKGAVVSRMRQLAGAGQIEWVESPSRGYRAGSRSGNWGVSSGRGNQGQDSGTA